MMDNITERILNNENVEHLVQDAKQKIMKNYRDIRRCYDLEERVKKCFTRTAQKLGELEEYQEYTFYNSIVSV